MFPKIKYTESIDNLIIEIKPNPKKILVVGNVIQIIMYVAVGFFCLSIIPNMSELPSWAIIVFLTFFTVLSFTCFLMAYYFFKRIFYKEIISVTKNEMIVEEVNIFKKKKSSFKLSDISHFTYSDREKFTEHPLANVPYDATGFGVGEKEVQYLIKDGTISFYANNMTYHFGKDVNSEDAEEIIRRIENFTGNDLRTDDKHEAFLRSIE